MKRKPHPMGTHGINLADNRHAGPILNGGSYCGTVAKPETHFIMSTGISGGGGNSSCQPGTPVNPTEVEVFTTVRVTFDALTCTTVRGSVAEVE